MIGNIKEIKSKLLHKIVTETELENILSTYDFRLLENDNLINEEENIIKFTDGNFQLWIETIYNNNDIYINNIKKVTKIKEQDTKVEPFRSFEDVNLILDYFKSHRKLKHWLISNFMLSFGRRIGDTINLKWSDLYLPNGTFREKLTNLKEEKTGKKNGVIINSYIKDRINDYLVMKNIGSVDIIEHYNEKIVNIGSSAFRIALKQAVSAVGLTYPISTHSFRKFYGNMMYKLNPDADSIKMIQFMFGHSSEEITKHYIAAIDEKINKMNDNYNNYLIDSLMGKTITVNKSPVVSIQVDNLRTILLELMEKTSNGYDKTNILNEALKSIENRAI